MGIRVPWLYQNWWTATPPAENGGEVTPVLLTAHLYFNAAGFILGARYYRDLGDNSFHVAICGDLQTNTTIRAAAFKQHAASGSGRGGWESVYFHPRVTVNQGDHFNITVWFGAGNYWRTLNVFTAGPVCNGPVCQIQDTSALHNNSYSYGLDLSTPNGFEGEAYGIDVIFWDGVSHQ
jgi:aromatic ring-cleaving dioxygenase